MINSRGQMKKKLAIAFGFKHSVDGKTAKCNREQGGWTGGGS